jgi:hypothetical protein
MTGSVSITGSLAVAGAATFSGNIGVGGGTPSIFTAYSIASFGSLSTTTNGITIASTTTGNGIIEFADGVTSNQAYRGYIQYAHTSDSLIFATAGSDRLTIASTGAATFSSGIGIGAATATTGGIQFPATAVAIADGNNLDDYEEGTFTPTIFYSGTNTPSQLVQLGRYTKVGRLVQVQILLNWNENGSTGNVSIASLPFTSVTGNNRAIPSFLTFGFTGLPTAVSITGYVETNSTSILLVLNDNVATSLSSTYTDGDQDLYATVVYTTV